MQTKTVPRQNAFSDMLSFWKRQDQAWKVTVGRTSLERFGYQMIYPYLSIFIIALGATKTQLGLMNSIGMCIAGLLGPITGSFIDRNGAKKIYIFGILCLLISYLTYALAPNWFICIFAMGFYWLGSGTSTQSCATICGNCLINKERARGMMICETLAAGLLGMAGPMLASWMIEKFGGVNVNGIRPLFYAASVTTALSLILVVTKLSNRKWAISTKRYKQIFSDGMKIIKDNRTLQKWLIIGAFSQLPMGMIIPYFQVFAKELKGADGVTLGAMVTLAALSSIVFGLPAGVLADKIGRKNVLYMLIPLFLISNLVLVWAPSRMFLLLAGVLLGFNSILLPIANAIERELVTTEMMGVWIGINKLVKTLFGALMALVGGIIWDRIGPQYLFIIYFGMDLIIRVPLLISLPETLIRKTT